MGGGVVTLWVVALGRGANVRYAILGPIGLSDGERLLPVGGARQVALLALLLVHANRALSSDRLIDALWRRQSPVGARKSLHVAISRLRKTLDVEAASMERALRTVAGGYLLTVTSGELDAEVFQTRMRDGRRALEGGDAERARDVLSAALGMWRGPALAEVAYEEFAQPEIRRLEELRLVALEAWVDAGLRLGEHGAVIAELESLVANHPARERLASQLMLALYRCGRQGDALDVYARTRAYLSGELGLDPGPALQALQAQILTQSPGLQHVNDERTSAAALAVPLAEQGLLHEHLTQPVRTPRPAFESGPSRTTSGRVRFNLPAVAASFTGREEELDALHEALRVTDRAVITQAITGLGGVGKSQLAARYVQQRADAYDLVAWIRAEDGGIADLAQLAGQLGQPVEGLSPSERAQLTLHWLNNSAQPWLLVLDNVESAEQLDDLRPPSGSGRVLVTSRDRALRQFGPVLSVDVFDEDTATAYLIDRADRTGDQRAAKTLACALGYLPLALSHAAAYCQNGTSFSDYLDLLDELPAQELFDSHPEVFYERTIASTWKTSIHAANAEAPLAADVLEMAAHLGPEAAPKFLFFVLDDANTAIGRKHLADALNALARFSLATVDDNSVGVHRLLQKTVRDEAAARNDQTPALHALAAMSDAFPDDVRSPASWPVCEQLLPHALALADALQQPAGAGPQLINLLNRASDYLNRVESGQRAPAVAQRARNHAERILGVQHPETLTTRHRLAYAYVEVGRVGEAIGILEALHADRERILGPEHPDTLSARHSLAIAYVNDERVDEAIPIFEALLSDRERILGTEHRDTLWVRHSLGHACIETGRIVAAIAILEQLLADNERILGAAHLDTLTTRHNLSRAYLHDGRVGDAIAIIEPLLDDRTRVLTPEHPQTLRTRHNLALAYLEGRRLGEATAIFEALLADQVHLLGAEHRDTLRTRYNLGRAYLEDERVDEAITIYERLLADDERLLGAEHRHTLNARHDLALAHQAAERVADV